jgi:DNA-binding winged helix-turn-helix (wHTH) protein
MTSTESTLIFLVMSRSKETGLSRAQIYQDAWNTYSVKLKDFDQSLFQLRMNLKDFDLDIWCDSEGNFLLRSAD